MVDAYGMWMAWGYMKVAPTRTFANEWKTFFDHAQYVVVSSPKTNVIPWTRELNTWFADHYHPIFVGTTLYIYQKDASSTSSGA